MTVAELVAELGLDVRKGEFAAGEKALEGIKHAIEALAVVEGIHAFAEMIEHVSEAADKASKTADKLGITTEAVQELGYAASLSDISAEQLQGSLQKMERRLDQVAQKGKGPAADALRRLGVSMNELTGKSADEKLERIADGFKGLGDNASKVALAMQLGLGPAMIPLLKEGGDGIREMREEARMLGLVIDGETAKSFEEWNDEVTRVKGAIQGLKNDAVVAILPVLKEVTENLFNWIKANRELIKQRLETVMKVLVKLVTTLVGVIGKAYVFFEKIAPIIGFVLDAIVNLVEAVTGGADRMEALAIAIGAIFVIANLPIILLLGLLAALALVIDDVWSGLNGGDSVLGELLESFEKTLGESGVGRIILGVKAAFVALFSFITDKIEWLENKGRALSKFVFEQIHGDSQFQMDEVNIGRQGASRLKHLRGIQPDATDDQLRVLYGLSPDEISQFHSHVKTADPSARGAFDKIVRPADTGIDTIMQQPRFGPNEAISAMFDNAMRASTPQVSVAAPQLHVEVHVQGNAGPDLPESIVDHVDRFFKAQLRDAQIATGAKGGKIP